LLFFRPIGSFDGFTVAPGVVTVTGWALFQGSSTPALAHVYVNGAFAGQATANQSRPDVAASVPGAATDVGFSLTVPLDRASNEVCAYAVSPAGTASALLSCRTIVVTTQPFGSLDYVVPTPGGVRVGGWAMDPNASGATDVHIYVNGRFGATTRAASTRTDVAGVYPAYGAAHGFDLALPVDAATNTVCAYVINVGPGDNQLLGCRTVVNSVQPFGSLDIAAGTPEGITVSGWAIDPDSADPIAVHVYVDGVGRAAIDASGARPDIAQAFPAYGGAHGFSTAVTTTGGNHTMCAFAINVRGGAHQLLACRTVFVPADPFGNVDVVRSGTDGIRVAGWAIDPNTNNPIEVHVYVGTSGTPVVAERERVDLAGPFPGLGTRHGFDVVVPGRTGQTVCLYAINAGPGATSTLGCRVAAS